MAAYERRDFAAAACSALEWQRAIAGPPVLLEPAGCSRAMRLARLRP
jgi:hypothetical protein